MQSKIYLTWITIFIISLFITSCGGGGGSSGSGGGVAPNINSNGDGNGDQCASGQTLQNGQCVAQRINEADILNQIRALTGRIQELEMNKTDNESTIAGLRRQITELESLIGALNTRIAILEPDDPTPFNRNNFQDQTTLLTFMPASDNGSVIRYRDNSNRYYLLQHDNSIKNILENSRETILAISARNQNSLSNKYNDGIEVQFDEITVNNVSYFILKYTATKDGSNLPDIEMNLVKDPVHTDWSMQVQGPDLVGLPAGTQTYEGYTMVWNRDIPDSNEFSEYPQVPIRPFGMVVDFENLTGSIKQNDVILYTDNIGQHYFSYIDASPQNTIRNLNQYYLEGNFTIDTATGTFTGTTLDLINPENKIDFKKATLYGTFHGSDAAGVSGVFHENGNSPKLIGALVGRKK